MLTYTGRTSETEFYSISTSIQTTTELSISATVSTGGGFPVEASATTTLTVGTSWTRVEEFGTTVTNEEEVELNLIITAAAGTALRFASDLCT